MNNSITIYATDTGEIKRNVSCPESMRLAQLTDGESYVLGAYEDDKQYIDIDTGSVVNKTKMPAIINKTEIQADGLDAVVISNLPVPVLVFVSEIGSYDIDDGEFGFTIDTPGEYRIKCFSFPFINKEYIVNAS